MGRVPRALLDGELADYSLLSSTMEVSVELTMDGKAPLLRDTRIGQDAEDLVWSNVDAGLDQDGKLRMLFGSSVSTCNTPGELR